MAATRHTAGKKWDRELSDCGISSIYSRFNRQPRHKECRQVSPDSVTHLTLASSCFWVRLSCLHSADRKDAPECKTSRSPKGSVLRKGEKRGDVNRMGELVFWRLLLGGACAKIQAAFSWKSQECLLLITPKARISFHKVRTGPESRCSIWRDTCLGWSRSLKIKGVSQSDGLSDSPLGTVAGG